MNDIRQAVSHLQKGNTILYPTDTIWGIGCDATNEAAVEKIFELKQRPKEKSLIVLVDSVNMLQQYVQVTDKMKNIIAAFTVPTTLIYSDPVGLAANAVNSDNTIAIRIVKHSFCEQMIREFGKPVISTSANLSGERSPLHFKDISDAIKNNADHIVPGEYDTSLYKIPSKLVRINPDHSIEYLR